jgi:hypothetical protein
MLGRVGRKIVPWSARDPRCVLWVFPLRLPFSLVSAVEVQEVSPE